VLDDVIENSKFADIMQNSIQEVILHFFTMEQNFGILCKIEDVSFAPTLPESIDAEFQTLTLFFLAGYTFETARIMGDDLVFEAGFGAENFGSIVTIPLLSIMQVIVDETPVLINLSSYKKEPEVQKVSNSAGEKNSMASFLSNPENSKFIKK
jgi:hypothetical protein